MRLGLTVGLILVSVSVCVSQSAGKEVVTAITRTDHRPVIDGILDDSTWMSVTPITGFMQYHPVEGVPPSESTALYIAYDRSNFYLAFKCYDSQTDEVRATLAQRESWDNDDCVGFAFDTYNSEREAFLFNINPYGIPSDFIWHHDGYCDNGWDADVRATGVIRSDGYCVECVVPFKSLRMPDKLEQEWGFYALRSIKRKGEREYYNHVRIKREILDESSVGLLMTNRDDLANQTYNRTLSADGVLRFRDIYSLKSQATGTITKADIGTLNAIGYNFNLERFGQNSYQSLWYNDFPEDFEAASGALWELIGYRELGLHNGLFIRQPIQLINDCELHLGGKARFDGNDELTEDYLWASAETSLDGVWTKLEIRRNRERHWNETFRFSQFEYELWNTPLRQIEYYLSLLWGDAPHYSEGFTGWKLRMISEVTFKPLPRVVYNINVSREDFYYGRGGSRCYLQTIVWNKLSYQILRGMFLRGIYQYNSSDRRSDASLLFAFEYSPVSNIYVGANFKDFSSLEDVDENLELFAKIGYLWRL